MQNKRRKTDHISPSDNASLLNNVPPSDNIPPVITQKRKRTFIREDQKTVLRKAFSENRYLDSVTKKQLQLQTALEGEVIVKWFERKRSETKS